jgi:uncharacterized membrane protein
MDNKKLGLIIIALGIAFSFLLFAFNTELSKYKVQSCGCTNSCAAVHEPSLLSSIGIAIIVALVMLGVYLLFFERSHQVLVKRLRDVSMLKSEDEKFKLVLLGLNPDEKKVLTAIREQDGITQHTLGIRTNLHKSKLSIIVSTLEQKGLIKKEKKGKTNHLYLRIKL